MNKYDPDNYKFIPAYFLVGVKTVIFSPDGKILLLQRSDKVSRTHGWDLVGGAVDKGEDPTEAAIREIMEETGMTVYDIKPITTYFSKNGDDEVITVGFRAKTDDTNIELSWESENYQWVSIDDIKDFNLPDLHMHIAETAMQ